MTLPSSSDLLFYSECLDEEIAPHLSEQFFVGVYRAVALNEVLRCENSTFVRLSRWKLGRSLTSPDTSFVAGALLLENCKSLIVKNVGATHGYGPLIYACVMHLARARGLLGAVPSRDPAKILPKPTNIWRRFAEDPAYKKKIALTPIPGQHPEQWLNNIYSLNSSADLLAFETMRQNANTFWAFWQSRGTTPSSLRAAARALAEKSVQAHQA
jgi:hypothetical protein